LEEGPGDILAFLTGQEEIESLERLIQERIRQLPPDTSKIWITPIYSSLPSEQQMNAFKPAPAGTRKVNLYILWMHNFPLFQPNDLRGLVS
jgi:ATP-dependent RNA helicase DHX8/PRP22